MSGQLDPLMGILREFGFGPPGAGPGDLLGLARGARAAGPTGLTLVVGDLATAGATLAAHLGRSGQAVDPAELDEAGLAQVFDLGGCRLLLIEPGDDTAAARFLVAHGPGVYRITLGVADRHTAASTPPSREAASPARADAPPEAGWSWIWARTARAAAQARPRRAPEAARRPFAAD